MFPDASDFPRVYSHYRECGLKQLAGARLSTPKRDTLGYHQSLSLLVLYRRMVNRSRSQELQAALSKVEEHSHLMASSKNAENREYHDRMRRAWRGLADGWRIINDIDKVAG